MFLLILTNKEFHKWVNTLLKIRGEILNSYWNEFDVTKEDYVQKVKLCQFLQNSNN